MENKNNELKKENIDLKEAYRIFTRRKWWFAVTAIIVFAMGIIYTFVKPINNIAIYQINIEKDYSNSNLSKRYPEDMESLNYYNADNISPLFRSAQIFESLKNLPEKVNYSDLLSSDLVTINRNDVKASIFTIKVYNPDRDLANKIALTLINTFDDYIKSKNKEAFDKIVSTVSSDIGVLEDKNQNLEEEITKLKSDIDSLYVQLYDYIVDYNLELASRLRTESQGSYSAYNVVIPPNKIEDEISFIKDDINRYKGVITANKSEIIELDVLKDNLVKDEAAITDKVSLVSEDPVYEDDDKRIRNILVSIILGIIVGIVVVFTANFFLSFKKKN
jgi:capsular polysaccharide biosynthesis protein